MSRIGTLVRSNMEIFFLKKFYIIVLTSLLFFYINKNYLIRLEVFFNREYKDNTVNIL